jgi:hypothetical protein
MSAAWVAASVRARSMVQRRVGAGGSRRIAGQHSLADALPLLAGSGYGERLARCTDLAVAERATRDTALWQLRVLAGWMPGRGARLARAAAGAYERDNIVALTRRLGGAGAAFDPFDPFELGALATSWRRLRAASSAEALAESLRRSPWGGAGSDEIALRDVLTVVWLRRLAAAAPAARPWAGAGCALIAARIVLVDDVAPSARIRELVRPVLGGAWETAADLAELRAALPSSVRPALSGIEAPRELWRAEAGMRAAVEADGLRLLGGSHHGPGVVLGAIAVLAMDAWRVRAALAAAAAGSGSSEVLDAVA